MPPGTPDQLPRVLVALMKGVVYRENDAALWQSLEALQAAAHDQVSLLGLQLIVDESEGYAYLRQRAADPDSDEREDAALPLPRLVARRPLGFPVSLLLALLRKRLAELDAKGGETRLIVSRDDMVDMMRLFAPDASNEARLTDRIDSHIGKVIELGFLRPLNGRTDHFEVRRILKAFVDAQWLHDFDERLAAYREHVDARG
jgi:hypothetical protein